METKFYLKDAYEIVNHVVVLLGKVKKGQLISGMKANILGKECKINLIEKHHKKIKYATKGTLISLEVSGVNYKDLAPHTGQYIIFKMHSMEFHNIKKPWYRKMFSFYGTKN